jgi:Na+/melibiose symporter-like transporter
VKRTAAVFLGAAIFSAVVGAVYWFTSYEPAGTFMLLTMMVGMGLASAYIALLSRRATLTADRPTIDPGDPRGEPVGVFASHSPYPPVFALGCAVGLTGLIYGWWLVAIGGAGVAWALLGFMHEDRFAPREDIAGPSDRGSGAPR